MEEDDVQSLAILIAESLRFSWPYLERAEMMPSRKLFRRDFIELARRILETQKGSSDLGFS